MRHSLFAAACLAALAGGMAGHAQAAAYTFSTITRPNTVNLQALGINNQGQIIVFGADLSAPSEQTFLDTGGNFTPVDFTGGVSVFNAAINNQGQIAANVGFFSATIDTNSAFTFLPTPTPAQLGFPAGNGANSVFIVTGINSSDVVTGDTSVNLGTAQYPNNKTAGFSYANGTFTVLPVVPVGINDVGQIVGSGGVLGTDGVFTPINGPGPASSTKTAAINNLGVIAGTYVDASGSHGFVDNNGAFTTIDVPSPPSAVNSQTVVTGINDAGDVVGDYTDALGNNQAFLATPTAVPEPASAALLGAGLAGLALVLRQRRRGA